LLNKGFTPEVTAEAILSQIPRFRDYLELFRQRNHPGIPPYSEYPLNSPNVLLFHTLNGPRHFKEFSRRIEFQAPDHRYRAIAIV
jgi:hypothetical protein